MSATSSADPADLRSFVARAGADTAALADRARGLAAAYDAFRTPREADVDAPAVLDALVAFVRANREDERFVAAVGRAFESADAATLPDAAVAAALKAAGVAVPVPGATSISAPVLNGLPLNSGWSEDPVCVATGHFVEPETDLPVPASLGPLSWTRVHNSRHLLDGAVGRGWTTWADCHLEVTDDGAELRAPDGQIAHWVAKAGGYLDNPDVEAGLGHDGDGHVLRWRWRSRHPGATWRFGADGCWTVLHQPGCGSVTAEREGRRLVAMTHSGGRRLALEWDGDRLRAVHSSDGRSVRYRQRRDDLIGVDGPAGPTTYDVDQAGRVVEVRDADGVRVVRNTYDGEGRVLSQESSGGRRTHFEYLGRLAVLVRDDAGGPRTLFRHDDRGRLVELTTASGTRLLRDYDGHGQPVRSVGLAGDETQRRYDDAHNLVWQREPDGSEHRWSYDGSGRVTSHTDAVGTVRTMVYAGEDPVPSRIEGPLGWFVAYRVEDGRVAGWRDADGVGVDLELDREGQVVAVRDAGGTTRLEWHPSGALAAVVGPLGDRADFAYDDAGRVVAASSPGGRTWRVERTPAGRRRVLVGPDGAETSFDYGPDGELVEIRDPLGGVTSLAWDLLGHLVGSSGPDGASWSFRYDGLSQLVGLVDPLGQEWSQHWDPTGHWLGVVDPTGRGRLLCRDSAGRVTGSREAGGIDTADRTVHDAAGRVLEEIGDGWRTTIERDALGRPTVVSDRAGRRTELAYTPAGRIATRSARGATWTYRYDRSGRPVEVLLPSGASETWSYDPVGRLSATTGADGLTRRVRWSADGDVERIEDDRGAVVRFERDRAGRLTALVRDGETQIRFGYDPAGRLTSVTVGDGSTATIRRNQAGVPVGLVDAKGASWTWELDPAGRPVAVVDPLGQRAVLRRDPAGRVVAQRVGDDAEVRYEWDSDGRLQEVRAGDDVLAAYDLDEGSRKLRARAGELAAAYSWDERGRPLAKEVGERTTTWDWDDAARTCTVVSSGGTVTVRHHDDLGRVDWVQHPTAGRITVSYDGAGRPVSVAGAGHRRTWTYDRDHLVGYECRIGDRVERTVLRRDASGRLVAEERNGEVRHYAYDRAGQLVSVIGAGGEWSWSYDGCGRMTTEIGPEGTRTFAYDAADQLVAIDGPGGRRSFRYDAAGRRVAEVQRATTRRYHWDRLGRLASVTTHGAAGTESIALELDANGELSAVGGLGVDWAGLGGSRVPLTLGGRTVIEVAGAVVALADAEGVEPVMTDWRGELRRDGWNDPWGSPVEGSGLGYLGEIGFGPLVWLRNRVYDTSTRCFVSRDPLVGLLVSPGGLSNPYAYAGNDPLHFADPLGARPLSMAEYHRWRAEEQAGHWLQTLERLDVGVVSPGHGLVGEGSATVTGHGLVGEGSATVTGHGGAGGPAAIVAATLAGQGLGKSATYLTGAAGIPTAGIPTAGIATAGIATGGATAPATVATAGALGAGLSPARYGRIDAGTVAWSGVAGHATVAGPGEKIGDGLWAGMSASGAHPGPWSPAVGIPGPPQPTGS